MYKRCSSNKNFKISKPYFRISYKLCAWVLVSITFWIALISIIYPTKKHPLAICAIFKNEAPFLKEWIEFHRFQGVKHFYLYDNGSTDNPNKVLSPYIKKGKVTLIPYNKKYCTSKSGNAYEWLSIQKGAYQNCLDRYGKYNKWIAFIDVDEFLYCIEGEKLPFFLKNYEEYGGVCVNWLLFGTSGVGTLDSSLLMIEQLKKCARFDEPRNRCVKSIVQPKYVKSPKSVHHFNYIKGKYGINTLGDKIKNLHSDRIAYNQIRINHYWTRDITNFKQVKIASRRKRRSYESISMLEDMANKYNAQENTDILQFVPFFKEKVLEQDFGPIIGG